MKWASASKLGSVIASYTYDGLNRRLRKVVAGSGSLDQDTRFYYSGWRCVEERAVTDDDPQSWAERPWKRYTWGGRYLDELVRYEADTTADGSVDKDYYVHQDALYNVVAVVAHGGDDDGQVVERVEYDPYGRARLFDKNNTPLSASALGLDYLFTGQRRDSETGLYYFKNRYYDAGMGRFLAKDPIGHMGGMHLYQYVANRPTVARDPLGLRLYVDTRHGVDWTVAAIEDLRKLVGDCGVVSYGGKGTTSKRVAIQLDKVLTVSDPEAHWRCCRNKKGFELIRRLIDSRKTVTITAYGNADEPDNATATWTWGGDSRVDYSPYNDSMELPVGNLNPDGTTSNPHLERTPSEIVLGHELVHSMHHVEGTIAEGTTIETGGISGRQREIRNEELQTVGTQPGSAITENDLRHEQGLPVRLSYGY